VDYFEACLTMGTWVETVFLESVYHMKILLSGSDNIPDFRADKACHDSREQPHSALGGIAK
jgi:hypothetical protein